MTESERLDAEMQRAEAIPAPPSVAFAVSRLGFTVGQELSRSLEPLGIGPREFGLLRALAFSQGLTQGAVATSLDLHPNRMVALVDQLEERALVRRRPHPSDRRAHTIVLTPTGEKLLQRAVEIAMGIEDDLCVDLVGEEREQLLRLLGKLRAGDAGRPGVHPGLAGSDHHPVD